MRTLFFNFDGTDNGRDDEVPTNILRLHRGLNASDQVSFYFEGPGNEGDDTGIFEELIGKAFGYGSDVIRDAAISVLEAVYRPGDRIAVTGFSRGAAVARTFCNALSERGVNGHKVTVAFLGCFDTVGAYLPFGPSQQGLFHDLHVSPIVERAAHAVAIHEDRAAFEPNLMNWRDGIVEAWFPGVHCDVGGGFEDGGLSDAVLEWMLNQMGDALDGVRTVMTVHPDPDAQMHHMDGLWRRDARRIGVKVDSEWSGRTPTVYGMEP